MMLRHYRSPFLPILARLGLFHLSYCSYDVNQNGYQYQVLGRPLGGDQSVLSEVLVKEAYQPILEALPEKPLRVLDIGSHIGSFMVWLGAHRTIAEGYCFEPDPDSFKLCQFNLAKNPEVEINMSAVGGTSRKSAILIDPVAHARSTIVEDMGRSTNTQAIEILVLSFADWMAAHPGTFDLLKMDCEGAEWEILRTCPEVFPKFSAIAAEIHHDPVDHKTKADFATAMHQLGFRIISNNDLFFATRRL
jgi:FkbM family methyltransferase